MAFYILQEDKPQGPYTIGQLRTMWGVGAVTGNTLYCQEGDPSWKPLSDLAEQLEPEPGPEPSPADLVQPAPKRKGIPTGVGLVIIILATVVIYWLTQNALNKGLSKKTLTAEITLIEDEALEIRNLDSFAWGPVAIFVNGTPPSGYRSGIGGLASGKAVRVSLGEFAKETGEKYKPRRNGVAAIWIGADGFELKEFEVEAPGVSQRKDTTGNEQDSR